MTDFFKEYGTYYRQLARLGLPIVAGQAGMILVSFADNVMVGHYSTEALASASFVNNVFNIAILTCIGFSYGITPLAGALFGREEKAAIGRLVRNGLLLNVIFSLMITGVMTLVYFQLPNLGQPEELLPTIRPYFLLYLAGILPISLFNVFGQWSYGIKRTGMPMWIILGANLGNVVGNYLLIYGNFGFPELGLTGAGISTLVSRWICPIVIICIFFLRKHNREYRDGFIHSRFNRESLRQLNITSWPVALQLGFETGSFSFSAVMAGWIGPIELAAFQVMVVVGSLGFCFYYSLGSATSVLVANAAGARSRRHAACGICRISSHASDGCVRIAGIRAGRTSTHRSLHHRPGSDSHSSQSDRSPHTLPARRRHSSEFCQCAQRHLPRDANALDSIHQLCGRSASHAHIVSVSSLNSAYTASF